MAVLIGFGLSFILDLGIADEVRNRAKLRNAMLGPPFLFCSSLSRLFLFQLGIVPKNAVLVERQPPR